VRYESSSRAIGERDAENQGVVHREAHADQITVGMIEVADKIKEILGLKPDERVEFMRAHAAPAVTGLHFGIYVTAHRRVARAALEGVLPSF
jgi:hypothetical protein